MQHDACFRLAADWFGAICWLDEPAPHAAKATATPEGHTVHRLAHAFTQSFTGRVVRASSPQGRFADGAAALDGLRLDSAEAWGKQMFLGFAGRSSGATVWLRVHLGLYGMWRFAGPGLAGYGRRTRKPAADAPSAPDGGLPEPRGLVRLRLLTKTHAADLSGPTACEVQSPAQKDAAQAKLGPDPLRADADPDRAWAAISQSRMAIGALLMRQDIVAGIGNIYRAEVLFRARIDPHRPGRALSRAAWEGLWDDLGGLMRDGVRTGRIITTNPADRRKAKGAAVRGDASYVAHRAGAPCRICGNLVQAEPMAGRKLYWCPACQTG